MLVARLRPAGIFIKMMECVKEIAGVLVISGRKEGIHLECEDTVNGVKCVGTLETGFFESYTAVEMCKIGVGTTALSRVMRLAQVEDGMEVVYSGGDTMRLLIEAANGIKKVEFDLKVQSDLPDTLPLQSYRPLAQFDLPSSEFYRLCRSLSHLTDYVTIEVTRKDIRLVVAGEMGEGQISLRALQSKSTVIADIKQAIQLNYLVQFTRAAALSETVTVQLFEEGVTRLMYTWPYGEVSFFLP